MTKAVSVTKLHAVCPHCNEPGSAIDHLTIGQSFGPWNCDNCGKAYRGTYQGADTVTVDDPQAQTRVDTLVLLELPPSDKPLRFLMAGNRWPRPDDDLPDNSAYYYEEHSCPTNWIGQAQVIAFGGDPDPHGFLRYVREIDRPDDLPDRFDHEYDNALLALFPELLSNTPIAPDPDELKLRPPEKGEFWTPNNGRHPDDTVLVSGHKTEVQISRAGGGFVSSLPVDSFMQLYHRSPEGALPYRLEFFSFDDCPWLLGFTDGQRWNGWGKPLFEKGCLEACIAASGDEMMSFTEDGKLKVQMDPEEEPEIIEPEEILWKGEKLTVYDLGGLGLCWNCLPLDQHFRDEEEIDKEDNLYDEEDTLEARNAHLPTGWEYKDLKQYAKQA